MNVSGLSKDTCLYNICKYLTNEVKLLQFLNLDELTKEEDVLEWLVQNKSTGDEEDVIEDVTSKTLDTLIGSVDNLVVLFCKLSIVHTFIFKYFLLRVC